MVKVLEYLYRRRAAVKWLWFAALAVVVLVDFFVVRHEIHFFGDTIPGFWSIFGLLVCPAMIVIWKWLAHAWLERDENYYGD